MKTSSCRALAILLLTSVADLKAAVNYEWVTVGNADNANDSTGYGSVAYSYNIGKHDVTNAQYTEFLNAVDPSGANSFGLYNSNMGTSSNSAGISFNSGAASGQKYQLISGQGNKPVTWVSFIDAMRFANWMNNGQGSATTESGGYSLTQSPVTVTHSANAAVWIPTENEWYKAAYYDPSLNSGAGGYWTYPTRSNTAPGNVVGSAANQANYNNGVYSVTQSADYSSSQNYLTDVGAFSGSASYYGTFDQGGELYQWNEATIFDFFRVQRGGAWSLSAYYMTTANRYYADPAYEFGVAGFRLASSLVPEPSRVILLVAGVGRLLMGRRRAKRTQPSASPSNSPG